MSAQASLATPEEDVSTLLQQVADEHGLEVQLNLPQAGAQVSGGEREREEGVERLFFFFVFFGVFFVPDPSPLSQNTKKNFNKNKTPKQVAAPPQAARQSAEPDLSERLAQLRGGAAK